MEFAVAAASACVLASFALLIVRLRWAALGVTESIARAREFESAGPSSGAGRLFVLLPALNEQPAVNWTLTHFTEMASRAAGRVEIVPITGGSESALRRRSRRRLEELAKIWWRKLDRDAFLRANAGAFPVTELRRIADARTKAPGLAQFERRLEEIFDEQHSTRELIARWLDSHPKARTLVRLIHEPAQEGTKATKLNFALRLLEHELKDEHAYVAVYDFDAEPHPMTFAYVLSRIDHAGPKATPRVLQQTPYQLKGMTAATSALEPSLLYAFWHAERALGYETFGSFSRERGHIAGRGLRLCMGSGLFVSGPLILDIGGFPSYSDDIALGYRLDYLGVQRAGVPYPAWVQRAASLHQVVLQHRRIYLGVFSTLRERGWAARRGRPPRRKDWLGIAYCHLHDVPLSVSLSLSLVAAAISAVAISPEAAAMAIGATVLVWQVVYWRTVSLATKLARAFGNDLQLRHPMLTRIVGAFIGPPLLTYALLAFGVYWLVRRPQLEAVASAKTER